ncbi:hypothetical protein BKA69DRAFT_1103985 [Paraphysoderma sedebokerense]|nr:hypothetical protein BKA69DRAFT_1103985 [Paraphysoderma sedebokerense]
MSGRKVYLEISIGDQALYEAHLDRFKRTKAFFNKEARKYGVCSESLDTMSDEDKEIFTEGWQHTGMKVCTYEPPDRVCLDH